jgi:hypothetical protein
MRTIPDVLAVCASQDGVTEGPATNQVKYNDWFYGRPVYGAAYKWCAVFVSWVMDQAGISDIRTARAFSLQIQPGLMWFEGSAGIAVGDIPVYDFNGAYHCGVVAAVRIGAITVWEGNTKQGNDTDGGHVMARLRPVPGNIIGYGRPFYQPPPPPPPPTTEDDMPIIYADETGADTTQVLADGSGYVILTTEKAAADAVAANGKYVHVPTDRLAAIKTQAV